MTNCRTVRVASSTRWTTTRSRSTATPTTWLRSFGDGIYVMIELQPGDHEIRIYAHDDGLDPMDTGDDFTVDVSYTLTVE